MCVYIYIYIGTAVVHVTTYVPSLAGVQPTVATFVLGRPNTLKNNDHNN